MDINKNIRSSVINALFGTKNEQGVKYICSCGSESFHVFMRYKSIDMMRFRCKECKKTYERIGNETYEIDLMAEWEKTLQRYR